MALPTVTINKQRRYGGPQGKSYLLVEVTIVADGTTGALAGDIPASLFGLKKITKSSSIIKSTDDKLYPSSPVTAGTSLLVGGAAANGVQNLPAGTYNMVLVGS